MGQPKLQSSFNSGEWAPTLYARVDQERYKAGAALLRNFFVDYRGGASTRAGTGYDLRAYKSSTAVALIPYQASFTLGYALEFGDNYIRFHQNGSPVLEAGLNITGATNANPCVVSVVNTYSVGDWVYISGVVGMTQLNGRYFIVAAASAGTITLQDLYGVNVNSISYGTWTSGGTTQRVYTIASPYAATDVADIRWAQDGTDLILCHPSYTPYVLTRAAATNWVLSPIVFGSSVGNVTGLGITTTLGGGSTYYSYIVTGVDRNGQEGAYASTVALNAVTNFLSTPGTNTITWSVLSGAVSYNVYRANLQVGSVVPAGMPYGFIGNTSSTTMTDSGASANFAIGPPVVLNPFAPGAPVVGATVTAGGSYTATPTLSFAAPGGGGVTATGYPVFNVVSVAINSGGSSFSIGAVLTFSNGIKLTVTGVGGGGTITSVSLTQNITITTIPSNPLTPSSHTGSGEGSSFNFSWQVIGAVITNGGSGYTSAPTITFSAGAATATAIIGTSTSGFPSFPSFFQQRLSLMGLTTLPQTMYYSQPSARANFNVSNPIVDSNAITATLVSGFVNNIRSAVSQPGGQAVLTDGGLWLINGGSPGSAITPAGIVANAQSYDGASTLPPIVANFDILYTTSRGSSVRDAAFNFYTSVITGTDISILSSHLFFGYNIVSWCWAQEPYKVVWAVRNDGTALTLTFLKDQEFIAWTHSDTNGTFKSVCTIVEATSVGYANFVYFVVERTINGQTVKYIERLADRSWSNATNAWCVDAGFRYSGSPTTSIPGGEHLAGMTCTGLADGVVIPSFTMPASGIVTVSPAASVVTVGLAFIPQLKTLPLDLGEPTVQGKVKKINAVDVLIADTLGLKIGSSFNHLVAMKDLIIGNVSSMLVGQDVQVVSGLVSGQARTFLDPTYTVPGQYCFQQDSPYPATILGVVPQITVGDTPK